MRQFSESGPFTIYKATDGDLNVLCGDVFNLDTCYAGPFDVIWDCNAIVAINADDREPYVKAELSGPPSTVVVQTLHAKLL